MLYTVSYPLVFSWGRQSEPIDMRHSIGVELFVNAPINHNVWITVQTIKYDDRFYQAWSDDKRRW